MSSQVTSAGIDPSTCWWSSTLGSVASRVSSSERLGASVDVAMAQPPVARRLAQPRGLRHDAAMFPKRLTTKSLRRAARHLRGADPVMARIVRGVGSCGLEVDRRMPPFAYLTAAIVHQQITGKAAASICRKLRAHAGGRWPRPDHVLGSTDAELRACGLSRQKIGYLRDLAVHVGNGLPFRRLRGRTDEEVIEALTAVKGIGRWTAEMFLMFRLGRPDVLPVDDLGIRKAMQKAWRKRSLPKPDWMRRTAEGWRPWRTVACWYLWQSLDAKP